MKLDLQGALDQYRGSRVRPAHKVGAVRYFLLQTRNRVRGAWQHLRHGLCEEQYDYWEDY